MPLRDHFHPPLSDRRPWEGMHNLWPGQMVRHLLPHLPEHYYAVPGVHLGTSFEVDVATFDEESPPAAGTGGNGIATALWAPPRPTRTVGVEFPGQDLVEVRVYDETSGSRLVAAVEIVSPRNKDRPAARRAFAVKCASYLQQNVALVVVDVVTDRRDNLPGDLLRLLGVGAAGPEHATQATAYRTHRQKESWQMEIWHEALAVGAALPTMPLWLTTDLVVPLELEASYEEACRLLKIA